VTDVLRSGYVYRAADALFIGRQTADLPGLRFEADVPLNLMIRRQGNALHIMATAEVQLRIDLRALFTPVKPSRGNPMLPVQLDLLVGEAKVLQLPGAAPR